MPKSHKVDPIEAKAIKANRISMANKQAKKAEKANHNKACEELNNSEALQAYLREQGSVYIAMAKKVKKPKVTKAVKSNPDKGLDRATLEVLEIVRAEARRGAHR